MIYFSNFQLLFLLSLLDSAYPDSGELSDRQETPPLQDKIREDYTPYVSKSTDTGPVGQPDRLSDYEWVDDDEEGAIADCPRPDNLNLVPKSTVNAAEILDLLKPIEQAETKAHPSDQGKQSKSIIAINCNI